MKIIEKHIKKESLQNATTNTVFVMYNQNTLNVTKALAKGDIYKVISNESTITDVKNIVKLSDDFTVVKRRGPIMIRPIEVEFEMEPTGNIVELQTLEVGSSVRLVLGENLLTNTYIIVNVVANTSKDIALLDDEGNIIYVDPSCYGEEIKTTMILS